MEITLTKEELTAAAWVGVQRALERATGDDWSTALQCFEEIDHSDPWAFAIETAAGCLAVAKAAGRYWPSPEEGKVGPWVVQVSRSGCLYLRRDNKDEEVFILVSSLRLPVLEICGWLYGCEGRRPDYWYGSGWPGYYPPLTALHPFEELLSWEGSRRENDLGWLFDEVDETRRDPD